MRARMALLAVAVCAVVAAAPATAGAQETPSLTKVVPVTGKSKNGKKDFTGTYAINRFKSSNGRVVAVGTLRGRLGNRSVTKRGVVMPAAVSKAATGAQLPPIPGACDILNLRLGPINLDLLGLVVRTNQINLRIDAVPGEGNLLGNLLCSITGLLDPQTAGVSNLAAALNAILALVPRTA
jgi:hypothetical protein